MNMKFSSIIEYLTFLIKKYGEIQQTQMKNTFRVASIKHSANGTYIIFQVIGKSTFMECSPAEILSNDSFLERFSKKDIQKITYAYAQKENSKTKNPINNLKLVRQEFNALDRKTKIALEDKNGKTTFKTAAEITLDKKIVDNLTQQDAINIGYIAGYEHSQNDSID